jgi:protocatechuate 3,4-dioxygenase beta subunit
MKQPSEGTQLVSRVLRSFDIIAAGMHARLIVLFVCVCVVFAGNGANAVDGHTVRGVVTTNDGKPIADAKVVLRADDTGRAEYGTLTATDGSFTIRNVANAHYQFIVNKEGYLTWTGQAKPKWPAPNVSLVISDSTGDRSLRIQLTRAASISGRILDERGNPIIGAEVRIYKRANFYGQWGFTNFPAPGISVQTNDLGEYRAYGLPPGTYVVAASYSQNIVGPSKVLRVDQSNLSDRYVPTFFPGVAEPGAGTPIEVGPDNDARGVDFTMSRTSVARIRGRLVNCGLVSPDSVSISLVLHLNGIFQSFFRLQGRVLDKDGDFEITGVPAGSYGLSVTVREPNPSFTLMPLEVGNREIGDVVVPCAQLVVVHGTVRLEGSATLPNPVGVHLMSLDTRGTGYGNEVRTDGTFTVQGFPPGKYRVRFFELPDNFFIKAVRLGDRDGLQNGVMLEGSVSDSLEILLSNKAASLSGTVLDENQKPVTGALVVLVPGSRLRDREDLYTPTPTDENGNFQLRGLTPGDYELYAWPYADAIDSYRDPDFLRKYQTRGKSIHLDLGATAAINLDLSQ